jgi:hypothetical protein
VGDVHGIPWAILPNGIPQIGAVNGYARIPWEGHPWSGCPDYGDLPVEVHGGLTYGPHPGSDMQQTVDDLRDATKDSDHPFDPESSLTGLSSHPAVTFLDTGGWVGFDTSHGGDIWTDEELAKIGLPPREGIFRDWFDDMPWSRRWTIEMVRNEARHLALQIYRAGVSDKREIPKETRRSRGRTNPTGERPTDTP